MLCCLIKDALMHSTLLALDLSTNPQGFVLFQCQEFLPPLFPADLKPICVLSVKIKDSDQSDTKCCVFLCMHLAFYIVKLHADLNINRGLIKHCNWVIVFSLTSSSVIITSTTSNMTDHSQALRFK